MISLFKQTVRMNPPIPQNHFQFCYSLYRCERIYFNQGSVSLIFKVCIWGTFLPPRLVAPYLNEQPRKTSTKDLTLSGGRFRFSAKSMGG